MGTALALRCRGSRVGVLSSVCVYFSKSIYWINLPQRLKQVTLQEQSVGVSVVLNPQKLITLNFFLRVKMVSYCFGLYFSNYSKTSASFHMLINYVSPVNSSCLPVILLIFFLLLYVYFCLFQIKTLCSFSCSRLTGLHLLLQG